MKIRTQELIGPALDWAVAQSEGLPLKLDPMGFRKDYQGSIESGWWVWFGTSEGLVVGHRRLHRGREQGYSPSTDWAQGGPIIEREKINIVFNLSNGAAARTTAYPPEYHYGSTALIAAMRCYATSKLGPEVEVPDELFLEKHQ